MDNVPFAVVVAGLTFLIGLFIYFQSRKRSRDIRELASKIGFAYLSDELPASLTLPDDPFSRIGAAWNVIDGERNGVRVVAFDCRIGNGKGSWARTIIAAQTQRAIFETLFSSEYTVDRAGEWTIFYQPQGAGANGLMPVSEIEARVNLV
jgi:hypothetical protein